MALYPIHKDNIKLTSSKQNINTIIVHSCSGNRCTIYQAGMLINRKSTPQTARIIDPKECIPILLQKVCGNFVGINDKKLKCLQHRNFRILV